MTKNRQNKGAKKRIYNKSAQQKINKATKKHINTLKKIQKTENNKKPYPLKLTQDIVFKSSFSRNAVPTPSNQIPLTLPI
ncbi:MAG: hypothetical protein OXJ52_05635, partial [Oligoflexia bacterium]|nr:hypothetical protein [Oligoflexia bacterium]